MRPSSTRLGVTSVPADKKELLWYRVKAHTDGFSLAIWSHKLACIISHANRLVNVFPRTKKRNKPKSIDQIWGFLIVTDFHAAHKGRKWWKSNSSQAALRAVAGVKLFSSVRNFRRRRFVFLKRAERRKNLPRLSRMKSWQNWHIIHWIVWEAYSVVVKSVGWKEKWFLAESLSEIVDRADFPICPWDFFLCELSARFFSGRKN